MNITLPDFNEIDVKGLSPEVKFAAPSKECRNEQLMTKHTSFP